jgi:molybdenum cofactor cytidylyltransferase
MGTQKALLAFGNGENFAGHLIRSFKEYGCDPVVLVVNDDFEQIRLNAGKHLTVVNHHIRRGRFYYILLGLQHIPEGHGCFVHNVDNPFLEPELLNTLIEASSTDNYVVPCYKGRAGHPVLLGSHLLPEFQWREYASDFREILKGFRRIEVPYPDERITWNINTPNDYKEFLQWKRK